MRQRARRRLKDPKEERTGGGWRNALGKPPAQPGASRTLKRLQRLQRLPRLPTSNFQAWEGPAPSKMRTDGRPSVLFLLFVFSSFHLSPRLTFLFWAAPAPRRAKSSSQGADRGGVGGVWSAASFLHPQMERSGKTQWD